jgi:hypothetical protein
MTSDKTRIRELEDLARFVYRALETIEAKGIDWRAEQPLIQAKVVIERYVMIKPLKETNHVTRNK